MKIILNIIVFAVLVSILSSCSDELDLAPITEKAASNFYSTEAEVETAVIGVYAQLQSNGLYGLDLIGAGEISGEDAFEEIAANDGGRFGQLDDFSTDQSNDLVSDIWRESYVGIQRTNIVLNRINEIEYDDNSLKNNRIGEMKFIRALLYFNLVRLYGDVPLTTEETTNPSDAFGQGRTAASTVYAQIELDLNDAINNLPSDGNRSSGRPAQGAARKILADVQMNQGNYGEAVTTLSPIVNSGAYQLMPSTSDIFGVANEGNAEILFEVQYASGVNGNSEGESAGSQFRPSGTTANAKGHNIPTSAFLSLYEEDDTRKDDYVGQGGSFNFSLKYDVSTTGPDDGGTDHIVIRYTDVLLKYAEALNESGGANATAYLDMVRNRAGLTNTTAVSQGELRDAIALERRLEFIGEGHRWFDLLRYGSAVETMNTWFSNNGLSVTIDNDNLVLPVPQSQLDTDPSIVQNPGY